MSPPASTSTRFHLNYSCYFGNDNYGYGEQFLGYKGTLEVLDRQNLVYTPQPKFIRGANFSTKPAFALNSIKDFNQTDATAAHVRNFLLAVLGREKAIAPARVGQIAAIPWHMATTAFRHRAIVDWRDNRMAVVQPRA